MANSKDICLLVEELQTQKRRTTNILYIKDYQRLTLAMFELQKENHEELYEKEVLIRNGKLGPKRQTLTLTIHDFFDINYDEYYDGSHAVAILNGYFLDL